MLSVNEKQMILHFLLNKKAMKTVQRPTTHPMPMLRYKETSFSSGPLGAVSVAEQFFGRGGPQRPGLPI